MRRLRWRDATADHLFLLSVIVALVPLVVATVRALRRDWLPVGDNAYFAIRAADVFSSDPPLLGTWTSNSLASGINANNPGALFFDALAVPARLFPGGPGLAVGVALLNGLAVVGIAVMTRRQAGPLLGMLATSITAVLCWAMGSELLFDPWQPHAMLLPFLAFLVLIWSVAAGDLVALPVAAIVGSLLVQTHLSYALMVPAALGWGVAGLALELRRRRRRDEQEWPPLRRRAIRVAVMTVLVTALCWAQTLVEQFTSDGDGNLTRLADTLAEAPDQRIGYGRAVQLIASVTVLPPWWVRPSFGRAWLPAPDTVVIEPDSAVLPALGLAVGALVALAAGLAWCLRDRLRRRDRVASAILLTAIVVLIAGLVTAGQAPVGLFGLAPHQFRWLWPLGAFITLAFVTTLARRVDPARVPHRALAGAVLCAVVVVAALNMATYNQGVGPSGDEFAIPVVRDLRRQMGALEDKGTLFFDLRGEVFASPYSAPIMAELQRRNISFVVKDPATVRQLGPARRYTGTNAAATLLYRVGDDARRTPPGSRRVALHEALTPAEQDELEALRRRLAAYIRSNDGLALNARGRVALSSGDLPQTARQARTGVVEPEVLLTSREVAFMVDRDLLVLDEGWTSRFERYAELQRRSDDETVALFLRPPPRRDESDGPS